MDNRKKIIGIVAGAVILAVLVYLVVLLTAGTPPALQPPVKEAPSGN